MKSSVKVSSLFENAPIIPVHPEIALSIGTCHAMLLQQIHYNLEANPVKKFGRKWCYYTYEEWASKLKVFGVRTIKTAMAELIKLRLVVSENHNPNRYNRTCWYSIDYVQLDQWMKEAGISGNVSTKVLEAGIKANEDSPKNSLSIGNLLHDPYGNNCTLHSAKIALSLGKEFLKENLEKSVHPKPQPESLPTGEDGMSLKGPTTASKLLAVFRAKKSEPEVTSNVRLHILWKKRVGALPETKGCAPNLLRKEEGHLNKIRDRVGPETVGLLTCVIQDWVSFAKFTAEARGLNNYPLKPTVSFLYAHVEDALVFYAKSKVQPIAHVLTEQVSPEPQKVMYTKEAPATLEYILELEKSLGL